MFSVIPVTFERRGHDDIQIVGKTPVDRRVSVVDIPRRISRHESSRRGDPRLLKFSQVGFMRSRKLQAVLSCALFVVIAKGYELLSDKPISALRVLMWSTLGVATYIGLSHLFGFDPHRTRLARFAPALQHYVDRWELRLGQATLAMLGCVVLAARFIDSENFVTAVVSGTLAAWTYFVLRLYSGGYKATAYGSN